MQIIRKSLFKSFSYSHFNYSIYLFMYRYIYTYIYIYIERSAYLYVVTFSIRKTKFINRCCLLLHLPKLDLQTFCITFYMIRVVGRRTGMYTIFLGPCV